MNVSIRKAEQKDSVSLFELASQLAMTTNVEKAAFEKVFLGLLHSDNAQIFIAEVDGKVIGYVQGSYRLAFYANGRVAWVEELFVEETYRKQSMGRLLMAEFESWAESKQCNGVALATRRAGPFYQALGYEDSANYFKKKL